MQIHLESDWSLFFFPSCNIWHLSLCPMSCSSAKEDKQKEKANRRLSEAGAAHPSGLIRPPRLPHRTGRFNGLQSGRGQRYVAFVVSTVAHSWKCPQTLCAVCSDHHRQDAVPWRVCHLPSGLLQHSSVCQYEKPRPAVPLHLPNQGRGRRSTGTCTCTDMQTHKHTNYATYRYK